MITVLSEDFTEERFKTRDHNVPDIEFGLQKVGDLCEPFNIEMSSGNCSDTDYRPLTDFIDKVVYDLTDISHDRQRRQGYFTAPFVARYALRGHTGKYVYVSEPQLMPAGLLPPCVHSCDAVEGDRRIVHFLLKGSPYFSLMIRATRLPRWWTDKVRYIDIYVSPQIRAYSYGGGRCCSYGDVLRSIDTAGPIHGKIDTGDSVRMFKGWYTHNGVDFKRHYTDPRLTDAPVWYVSPDNDLAAKLYASDRFYRIASLRADRIGKTKSFVTISVSSTENGWIERQRQLEYQQIRQAATLVTEATPPHPPFTLIPAHHLRPSPLILASGRLSPDAGHILLPQSPLRLIHTSGLSPPQKQIARQQLPDIFLADRC